jgi:hypothetical protein
MGLLERIDERLERIEARLAKCGPDGVEGQPIEQGKSPLGRRRHCAAVRRMVAAGDGRAFIVGRKHFLTADALAEEMARISREPPAANEVELGSGPRHPAPSETTFERAMRKAMSV